MNPSQNVAYTPLWMLDAIQKLQTKEYLGSHACGIQTAQILQRCIEEFSERLTFKDLLHHLKTISKKLVESNLLGFVIPNTARRVLCILRMEYERYLRSRQENIDCASSVSSGFDAQHSSQVSRYCESYQSNHRLGPIHTMYLDSLDRTQHDLYVSKTMKQSFYEGITELIDEMNNPWSDCDETALVNIFHANDVILTFGYSTAVERQLKRVSKDKDSISVIVVNTLDNKGEKMAKCLQQASIDTTLISESAIFSEIPGVDKVIIGAVALLSSGDAVSYSGGRLIAQISKDFVKPLVVIAPLFKLTHISVFDNQKYNRFIQPKKASTQLYNPNHISIRIPLFDHIPGKLITLIITDVGPVNPCNLFKLTKQRYHEEDLEEF